MTLGGRVAFITGAARGIGLGIATRLAKEGAGVVVADIDQAAAEAAAAGIRAAGSNGVAVACDIRNLGDVERAVKTVTAELGDIDILVNNAGWSPNKAFLDTTTQEWDAIIGVNFTGMLNCTRTILPKMIDRRGGRVISIGSDAARAGTPKEAVYAGAKNAVIGFSRSLAAEVAQYGITVNVVCPSSTDTPLLRSILSEEQLERRIKGNPMGRLGQPEDIAAAVLFFASEGAGYITGQVLSVNGGSLRVG